MDDFEFHSSAGTPLEAAVNVIPEDHWNVEPRYTPSVRTPGFDKIAPVFGERVINGEIQACSVEDIVPIHQEIATVLDDEHSLTAVTTISPYPYDGISGSNAALANNDTWLMQIRDGHWPLPGKYTRLNSIYAETAQYDTELSYDEHDTADKHIAFMLLAPREMQDQITEAAEHGVEERLEALSSPNAPTGLVLSGERRGEEYDPLDYSWRGNTKYGDANAMKVIDEISDDPSFVPLMEELLVLNSSEERHAYVQYYSELATMPSEECALHLKQAATETLGSDTPDRMQLESWIEHEKLKAGYIGSQMRSIVAVTNFNMRHREQRNMTIEEQTEAKQAYLTGLLRVADKLSGDYTPQAA